MKFVYALACGITMASGVSAGAPEWVPLNSIQPRPSDPTKTLPSEHPSTPTAPPAPLSDDSRSTRESMIAMALNQMESQRHWGGAERAKAKDFTMGVESVWIDCIKEAKLRLRVSKDEVATIATAVLGTCEPDEQLLVRSMRLVFRGFDPVESDREVEKLEDNIRAEAREDIITYLVNYRIGRSAPPK